MNKSNHIKIAMVAAWRAAQVFVVIPASLAGALVIGLAILGKSPIESTISAIYEWAETSVRPAPVGAVLVAKCDNENSGASGDRRPISCNPGTAKVVPAAEAAKAASEQLVTLYWIAVVLSFGLLMVVRPGQFFDLHNQAG